MDDPTDDCPAVGRYVAADADFELYCELPAGHPGNHVDPAIAADDRKAAEWSEGEQRTRDLTEEVLGRLAVAVLVDGYRPEWRPERSEA